MQVLSTLVSPFAYLMPTVGARVTALARVERGVCTPSRGLLQEVTQGIGLPVRSDVHSGMVLQGS